MLVGVTGFEPAASKSQTSRATSCATPRYSVLCNKGQWGSYKTESVLLRVMQNFCCEKDRISIF